MQKVLDLKMSKLEFTNEKDGNESLRQSLKTNHCSIVNNIIAVDLHILCVNLEI